MLGRRYLFLHIYRRPKSPIFYYNLYFYFCQEKTIFMVDEFKSLLWYTLHKKRRFIPSNGKKPLTKSLFCGSIFDGFILAPTRVRGDALKTASLPCGLLSFQVPTSLFLTHMNGIFSAFRQALFESAVLCR